MSILRRLARLESKPIPRRESEEERHERMMRVIQKKLHLPLPEQSSDEEHARGLELLKEMQRRTRIDQSDTSGFDAVREYADSLHAKYGTTPFWG